MRAYVRIRSSKASPPNSGRTMEHLWNVMKKGLLAGDTLR
jgi:hypothetical protein